MARSLYMVQIAAPEGTSLASEKLPVIVSRTAGGSQESDLLSVVGTGPYQQGSAISQPDPDDTTGMTLWYGPDNYVSSMWVRAASGGLSIEVLPVGIADRSGAVSSVAVNGGTAQTGAVNLTINADSIADGTTHVMMTQAERDKLAAIADGATANLPDLELLDRNNHINKVPIEDMASDVTTSTGLSGQLLGFQDDGGPLIGVDAPAGSVSGASTLIGLDDVETLAAANIPDGAVPAYLKSAGKFMLSPGIIGGYPLGTGQTAPTGIPRSTLVRTGTTSLVKGPHVMEGTAGQTATAAALGFSGESGAAKTFTSTPPGLVGSTSVIVAAGGTGYFYDSGLAMSVAVLRTRFRFVGAASTNVVFLSATTATPTNLAFVVRNSATGYLDFKDPTLTRATISQVISPDTWYILEWKIAQGTQTARLYNAAGAQLGAEVSGSCTVGDVDQFRQGVMANPGPTIVFDNSAIAADWIGNAA